MQVFSKALRWLIASALVAFGFFQKNAPGVFLAAASVIGLVLLIRWIGQSREKLIAWARAKHKESVRKKRTKRYKVKRPAAPVSVQPRPVQQSRSGWEAALRHLNCRITERIQNVFPNATWEWTDTNPAALALRGGKGKIRISQAEKYNYAEVSVNELSRLRLTMLQAVDLEKLLQYAAPDRGETEEQPQQETAPGVDVNAWCDLVGRDVLYTLCGNLCEKGFKQLKVSEDGNVYAVSGEEAVPQIKLGNMPPVNCWPALTPLLSDESHTAAVENGALVLRW